MISGEQIRAARERARMSQQELAKKVGVSLRTVGNWERGESIPRNREHALRQVLQDLDESQALRSPLEGVPDSQLLLEVARRFTLGELARAERDVFKSRLDIANLPPPTPEETAKIRAKTLEALEQLTEDARQHGDPSLPELERRLAAERYALAAQHGEKEPEDESQ